MDRFSESSPLDLRSVNWRREILAAAPPSRSAGKIPYNVACREIVSFVTAELKASGEQWNDQAKQDLVSTFIIAASKAGMLQVWERGEK